MLWLETAKRGLKALHQQRGGLHLAAQSVPAPKFTGVMGVSIHAETSVTRPGSVLGVQPRGASLLR